MLTRRQLKAQEEQRRLYDLLLVLQCMAHVGFGAEVGLCTLMSRSFRGDEALWEVFQGHKGPRLRTRLMYAAKVGDSARLQFLLDRGARLDDACKRGLTAIAYASQEGHLDIARLLLDRGANVNAAMTDIGFTSLMLAMENGDAADIVQLLLLYGAQ